MKKFLTKAGCIFCLAGKVLSQTYLPETEQVQLAPSVEDTPTSYKLRNFFQDLYHPTGQNVLCVVGDSINATNTPNRMPVGYRNNWRIVWNSWFVHADSGVSDNGFMNGQNASVNEIRLPGDVFVNSYVDVSPVRTRDLYYGNVIGNGWTLSDCVFPISSLNQFRLGNPLTGLVFAKLIHFNSPNSFPELNFQGTSNSISVQSSTITRSSYTGLRSSTIVFNVAPGASPGSRIVATVNSANAPIDQRQLIFSGTLFGNSSNIGTRFFPITHGGWRLSDHIQNYSTNTLRSFFEQVGTPTHIIIWLGQNQSSDESSGLSSGNNSVIQNRYETLLLKYFQACFEASGTTPRVLFVSQYQTGYFPNTHRLIAKAQYNLSRKYPTVSFYNLYKALGEDQFDKTVFLSDGVHPNLFGTNWISSVIDSDAYNSVQGIVHAEKN